MDRQSQEGQTTTNKTSMSQPGSAGTASGNPNEALAKFFAGLVKKPGPQITPLEESRPSQLRDAHIKEKERENNEDSVSLLREQVAHLAGMVETCDATSSTQKDLLQELRTETMLLRLEAHGQKAEVAQLSGRLHKLEDDILELRSEKAVLQSKLMDKKLELTPPTNKLHITEIAKDDEGNRWEYKKQEFQRLLRAKDDLVQSTRERLRMTATAQELLDRVQDTLVKIEPIVTQRMDATKRRLAIFEAERDRLETIRESIYQVQSLQAELKQVKREALDIHQDTQSPVKPEEADVRAAREKLQSDVVELSKAREQNTPTSGLKSQVHTLEEGHLVGKKTLMPSIAFKTVIQSCTASEAERKDIQCQESA